MVRVLFILAFLSYPVTSSTDEGTRDPLTPSHDQKFENANRVSALVEQRFKLYAAVANCRYTDNLYAFRFSLDRFDDSEQVILKRAADKGLAMGRSVATVAKPSTANCDASIAALRAADDALLVEAEAVPTE